MEVEPDSGLLPRIVHPRLFQKRSGVGTDLDGLAPPLHLPPILGTCLFDQVRAVGMGKVVTQDPSEELAQPETGYGLQGCWFFESHWVYLFLSWGVVGMSCRSAAMLGTGPSSLDDVAIGSLFSRRAPAGGSRRAVARSRNRATSTRGCHLICTVAGPTVFFSKRTGPRCPVALDPFPVIVGAPLLTQELIDGFGRNAYCAADAD